MTLVTNRVLLVHAIRSLRSAPGFAIVAGLTLAITIGSAAAMFSLVDGVLLQPLPIADPASHLVVALVVLAAAVVAAFCGHAGYSGSIRRTF